MSSPTRTAGRVPPAEQLRLTVIAARLYHVHGVRQRDIGVRLGMSQARVSRVLRQAEQDGIVHTVVTVPEGHLPDLEERLEGAFGLAEAHVVDVVEDDVDIAASLGRAAARYLAEASLSGRTVGFTSWSRTLQEMALALPELPRTGVTHVVEMLGDLGAPDLQHAAARSTQALARALDARAVFLRTPGVMATPPMRDAALADPHVARALGMLDDLDVAFVGVGPPDVHSMLRAEDNYFDADQLARAREAGAVGQLIQRLVDREGRPLATELDDLVVGATLDQLRAARRTVVVAGGRAKHAALAAALAGGWVDVLITDTATAQAVLADRSEPLQTAARGL